MADKHIYFQASVKLLLNGYYEKNDRPRMAKCNYPLLQSDPIPVTNNTNCQSFNGKTLLT